MGEFYKLADDCTTWYSSASDKFASDVQDMKGLIKGIVTHRFIVMKYA
jgi:hypothetical protein